MLAGDEFAQECSDKRPKDDAQESLRTKWKSNNRNDKAYIASQNAGITSAMMLGAPRGDHIVENSDNDSDSGCDNKKCWTELNSGA